MLSLMVIPGLLVSLAIGLRSKSTVVAASLPLSIWLFAAIPFIQYPSAKSLAVFLPFLIVGLAFLNHLDFPMLRFVKKSDLLGQNPQLSSGVAHASIANIDGSRLSFKNGLVIAASYLLAILVDLDRWRGFPRRLFDLVPQNTDYTFHIWQVSKIAMNGLRLPDETSMVDSFEPIFWSYQYGAHLIPGLISDGSITSSGTAISLFLFLLNTLFTPILLMVLISRFTANPVAFASVPAIHLISPNFHLASLHLFAFNVGLVLLICCVIILTDWSRRRDNASLIALSISIVSLGIVHKALLAFFAVLLAWVCVRDLILEFSKKSWSNVGDVMKSQVQLIFVTIISGYFLIFFTGNYGSNQQASASSLSVLKYLFGEKLKEKNTAESILSPIQTLLDGGSYLTVSTSIVFGTLGAISILWISLQSRKFEIVTFGLFFSIVSLVLTATADIYGLRRWFGGMWLGEAHRAAAVADIFLICSIVLFLAFLSERMELGRIRTSMCVWVAALVFTSGMSGMTVGDTFRGWIGPGSSRVVSPVEIAGFQEIDMFVPPGSRLFNFFGDGSPLFHFESEVGPTWVWGDISSDPDLVPYVSNDLDTHAENPSVETFEIVSNGFKELNVCGILISSGNVHMWAPRWWEVAKFDGFERKSLSEEVALFVFSEPPERCQTGVRSD